MSFQRRIKEVLAKNEKGSFRDGLFVSVTVGHLLAQAFNICSIQPRKNKLEEL